MPAHQITAEYLICDETFQRFYAGTNKDDTQYWEQWIKQHPQHAGDVQEAIRIISLLSARQGNLQEQLYHLQDGIRRFDQLKLALHGKEKTNRAGILKYATGAAASLVVLAAAVYFIYLPPVRGPQPGPPVRKNAVIRSGNESRKTIVLPDGSVVTLRNNSHINYSTDYNTSNRELVLSGEAFFDVTHNAAMPFIVHTAEADIEVLGTVFNVSAYPGSGQTETALIRGKISVATRVRPSEKTILTPSEKVTVFAPNAAGDKSFQGTLQVVPITPDPVNRKAKEIAWVRNRLKIEDEPLDEIANKLQSWYGINMVFEDEDVRKYRYSGTFENESILKALEALQLSYPFHFRVEKERIIISR